MIVSTTPWIDGTHVSRYLGVIAGEAIVGAHLGKDWLAGLRDSFGGRSGAYEGELEKARRIAMRKLESRAIELGANAVIGVSLDYEVLGQTNGMLMVCASGTAVLVERSAPAATSGQTD